MGSGKREMRSEKWAVRSYWVIAKKLICNPLLFIFYFLFSISSASAETPINISAEHLEHTAETDTYFAKGSVKISYKDTTLNADEIHFNNTTADAVAIGNVIYEDTEIIIKARKIELNLDTKLGTIYNSKIFYKQRNYHIDGGKVKRLGANTYSMDTASATTCDATPPEWHFTGKDIKIKLQENIKARNVTFYIKSVPVLYSPYFWAPLLKERQTGFLLPALGYSSSKGFTFKQGFFWAVKDNMDATLYADYYGKKGLGKGLDYRYITGPETSGELWMYHLGDNELSRDFFELKSYHNQKLPYDMSGYLKMHFVNKFDYYNVLGSTSSKKIGLSTGESDPFGFASEERLQKYLESNLQISKPFAGGRTYLLGQYRQNLEGSSGTIAQILPEAGFIINTRNIGIASFNMEVKGTNFWKNNGQQGQRLDIYPNIYLSLGRTVNFTQKIGLRETLYFLRTPAENSNREIFDLNSIVTTRFLKRYSSFIHIIEPSVEYVFVPDVDHSNIPLFDSIDSLPRTSDLIYTITNRVSGSVLGDSEARLRLSQRYSLLAVENPFSPILIESNLTSKKFSFNANALYDVYDKSITETFASVNVNGDKGFVGIGKNFRRLPAGQAGSTPLDQYSIEGGINKPINIFGKSLPLDLSGKIWYDLKGGGIQEFNLKTIYSSQCWSLTVSFTRKPFEYQIMFGINFKGFGALKIG
jgi:LPS-assembly protein